MIIIPKNKYKEVKKRSTESFWYKSRSFFGFRLYIFLHEQIHIFIFTFFEGPKYSNIFKIGVEV